MRTAILLRFLLLVLLFWGSGQSAKATHVLGGELSYTYIAGSASQYQVVVRLYIRDPTLNVPDQPRVELSFLRNGCSLTSPGSFALTVDRSQLTPRVLGCAGNSSYNVVTYETIVTLPPGRWTLNATAENRSVGIRNLNNSGYNGFQLNAFLDNNSGLINSSPRFTSFVLPYVGGSQPYRYSFSTFEPDGDSLVYQAVAPLTNLLSTASCGAAIPNAGYPAGQFQDPSNGQTVSYPAGQFTPSFPILSFRAINGVAVPQFELNAANGELLTTPILQLGSYTVAIRVDEYRRLSGTWTLIGNVTRDVVYSVFNAGGNRNPSFTGLTVTGVSQPVNQALVVRPGQLVSLTLTAADPDAGQILRLSSDAATVVAGAAFQVQGPNQGVLTWQVPATLRPGRYTFTVAVADDACPVNGVEVRTISFLVADQALATRSGRPLVVAAYPTPFQQQVQFQLPTAAMQPIAIFDNLGRVVDTLVSGPDGTVLWRPAAAVAAGTYFARPADGRYVFRLLRQ